MRVRPVPAVRSALGRIAFVTCIAAYAYWATGLRPFTLSCYVTVGIPVAVVGSVVVRAGRGPAGGPQRRDADAIALRCLPPWLLVALIASGREGLGLALGGRSTAVPTLSTVIDHALAWHAARVVLFCGWLVLGSLPPGAFS
jgi:hypothetical protein